MYLGRALTAGNYQKLDDISASFNNTAKTFNLTLGGQPFYPGSVFSILVSVANVIQNPGTAYTIDQATITFASAPTTGSSFFCIVLGTSLGVGVPADGTITGVKLSPSFSYNSGLLYLDSINNRVGIGSTIPTFTLDVSGNSRVSGTTNVNSLSVTGIATLSGTTIFNPGPVLVGTATSTGTAKLQVSGNAYVSSSLGIGTASPSGSLDVSGGTIRVRNNGTYSEPNDNAGVLAYDSTLSEFTVSSRSSSASTYLRFLTSISGTSNERLRINTSGNILINTTSDTGTSSQPLQVSGGAYVSGNFGVGRANPTYKIDAYGGSGLRVGGVSGDGYLLAYDSSTGSNVALEATDFANSVKRNLTLQPNGGNVLIGSATSTGTVSQPLQVSGGAYVSGNVGIGTATPSQNLQVQGNARITGGLYDSNNNVGTAGSVLSSTGSGLSWIAPPSSGISSISISTNTANQSQYLTYVTGTGNTTGLGVTTSLVFNPSTGNLGIGTTSPTQKLQVQGNISINGTVSYGSTSATTATVSQTGIHSGLSTSTYRSVEYMIQATQGTNYHATKILSIHNGTTAYNSEYGTIYNNTTVGVFDVDVSGGNMRLLVTPSSASTTNYNINFVATVI
jgi:hypothetical protein